MIQYDKVHLTESSLDKIERYHSCWVGTPPPVTGFFQTGVWFSQMLMVILLIHVCFCMTKCILFYRIHTMLLFHFIHRIPSILSLPSYLSYLCHFIKLSCKLKVYHLILLYQLFVKQLTDSIHCSFHNFILSILFVLYYPINTILFILFHLFHFIYLILFISPHPFYLIHHIPSM